MAKCSHGCPAPGPRAIGEPLVSRRESPTRSVPGAGARSAALPRVAREARARSAPGGRTLAARDREPLGPATMTKGKEDSADQGIQRTIPTSGASVVRDEPGRGLCEGAPAGSDRPSQPEAVSQSHDSPSRGDRPAASSGAPDKSAPSAASAHPFVREPSPSGSCPCDEGPARAALARATRSQPERPSRPAHRFPIPDPRPPIPDRPARPPGRAYEQYLRPPDSLLRRTCPDPPLSGAPPSRSLAPRLSAPRRSSRRTRRRGSSASRR